MSVICKLFRRSELDNLAASLGNMMISGAENTGRIAAYKDLIELQLYKNRTLILFQDDITDAKYSYVRSLITPFGKKIYDIRLSAENGEIDILTAFKDASGKARFITTMLGYAGDISESLRSRVYSLFYYAIDTFDRLGRAYKLCDLMRIDPDVVALAVGESELDSFEKERRIRSLTDVTTKSAFLDIEPYMIQLENEGICRVLSGNRNCAETFSSGNVTLISGFAGDNKVMRELLLNSVMYAVNASAEGLIASHPLSVVVSNANFMNDDVAKSLMEYNTGADCAVYVVMEDISKYIEKNGNELLEKTKSFMVFTQASDPNASFWSQFFGSRDTQERSFSYTKRRGLLSILTGSWDSGGVVPGPRKYSSTTTSVQTVNKPIYRPEVFRELRPLDVMCYVREPLFRRKLRIE